MLQSFKTHTQNQCVRLSAIFPFPTFPDTNHGNHLVTGHHPLTDYWEHCIRHVGCQTVWKCLTTRGLCDHSFRYASSCLCNQLPTSLRQLHHSLWSLTAISRSYHIFSLCWFIILITHNSFTLSLPAHDIFPTKDSLLASRLTPWTSWLDHFFCATGFLFLVLFITSFFWFYAAEIKLASHHLLGAIKYSLLHRTMQLKSKIFNVQLSSKVLRFSSRTGEGRDSTRQPANSGSPGKPPLKQRFTCSLLPQTASGHTKHFAPVTLDNQGSKCLTKFRHEWWLFYAHLRVGERPHYALVTLTQRKKRLSWQQPAQIRNMCVCSKLIAI